MEVRYMGRAALGVDVQTDDGLVHCARGDWVDLPSDIVGHRPKGQPGTDADQGSGLLAQGDWDGSRFDPVWETRAGQTAKRTARTKPPTATVIDVNTTPLRTDVQAAPSGEED
jgi:hypothetical protein